MWSKAVKTRAIELRTKGDTLKEISESLHISKSTLSDWFRDVSLPNHQYFTNRTEWLRHIRTLASEARKRGKLDRIEKASVDVKEEIAQLQIDSVMKKTIVSMLYWCEGSKGRGGVCFANTDPRLMRLFLKLLRECYPLDESRLRIRLHLHFYHKESEIKKFWSELLRVPENQFYKTYRKYRSKEKTFRRNFGGICYLRYNSEDLKDRIMRYATVLGDKITGPVSVP